MKKFIITLIFTLSFLIMSNVESKGSCISGYTQDTVTVTIGNCDYKITVCYQCQVTHPGNVYIKSIEEVDSSCNNALNITQIIDQAYAEVSNGSFIYSNLCPGALYPTLPCDEFGTSYNEFNVLYSYCWQVRYRYNGFENIYEFIPCEENAYCTETIRYCFDDPDYVILNRSTSSPQVPPCELEHHEITYPTMLNETSDCFILNSVPCGIAQP